MGAALLSQPEKIKEVIIFFNYKVTVSTRLLMSYMQK